MYLVLAVTNLQTSPSTTLLPCALSGDVFAYIVHSDTLHRDSLAKLVLTLLLKFYFTKATTAKALMGY